MPPADFRGRDADVAITTAADNGRFMMELQLLRASFTFAVN
jgi:hypothetical protein